jgi:hypothetical protein
VNRRTAALLSFVLGVSLACAGSARADDVVKRPVPDYDGRGDPPTTAGDVLIWVPRVIVSPFYLIGEFLLRRPLGALVRAVESNDVVQRVEDVLGIGQPVGLVPTFFYDLAAHPHFGLYFFWDGFIAPENALRMTASAGVDYLAATVTDRVTLGKELILSLRYNSTSRSDQIFYGIGGRTTDDNRSRYEIRRLEGSAAIDWGNVLHRVRLEVGERDIRFGGDSCCDDPSLRQAVDRGFYPLPFGFSDGGYTGPWAHLRIALDTRAVAPDTGVGLVLDGEIGSDLSHDRSWIKGGGSLGGSIDVSGTGRVFSIIAGATIVEPLSGEDVPFTELAGLGGTGPLPGFPAGQLVGRSDVHATLSYEWPVWIYMVGVAHVAVGNVFGPRLEDFDVNLLRFTTGIGLRSIGPPDHRFSFQIAFGTKPFDQGFTFDAIGFVIGGVTGF